MHLMMRVTLVDSNRSSRRRAVFFSSDICCADDMVLSTKMAEMTLKRPMVSEKTKRQYIMLCTVPKSLKTNSKIGTPPAVLQSPKLQRNVESIERGIESKYSETFSTSDLPNISRKARPVTYTTSKKKIMDHIKVERPPVTPWIMSNRSLKKSVLKSRSTLAILSSLTTLNKDADGVLARKLPPKDAMSITSCTQSIMTRVTSPMLRSLPSAKKCPRTPCSLTFSNNSTMKSREKRKSTKSHPKEPSEWSMETPTKTALAKIMAAMMLSISSSWFSGSR
mmetsp:Transcript_63512/g.112994  ORF Transcript_63512/g.112994 Transcript_63512/m.112994 type:complete len:279 (-) Transcript_63512:843-1679(-)